MINDPVMTQLHSAKRIAKKGGEHWLARDIQPILGYAKWDNFVEVVRRAARSCKAAGLDARDHILGTRKMVEVGSGAKVEVEDIFLSRYACYLVAMNGDSSKPEIASAQRYFAVQTRIQELDREEMNLRERTRLRLKLAESTKHLHAAAQEAGVQDYALFHNAGYLGLYEMGLAQIKARKGLARDEDLYDRAGRLELSANEFKAALTEHSIKTKNIRGQKPSEAEHRRMGSVVRETLRREAGVYPEDLPAEPPLKALPDRKKKSLPDTGPQLI